MKRFPATIAVLACVAVAQATITASWVHVPAGGDYCYDIVVTVADDGSNPDDWLACEMTATLFGGATFINGETFNPPPIPFIGNPYDSFFTSPQYYPTVQGVFGAVSFADPAAVVETPTLRFAEWYDTADTGAGTFVLHRLNVYVTGPSWLIVEGTVSAANSGGNPVPFYFGPITPPCFGDLDFDWDVDLSDLAQLLSNFGMPVGAWYVDGDIDGDGDVDLADLAELLSVYGTDC